MSAGDAGADAALLALLRLLKARDYAFVTPTPATHARVVARPERARARTLEDALGWSLPFARGLLPDDIARCLHDGGMIEEGPDGARSRVRVSRLRGDLYLHSAYPTLARDAVFFGPDSYRFADAIVGELERRPLSPGARIVDVCAGTGVGAIVARWASADAEVLMTDLNPAALRLARINARAAGLEIAPLLCAGLDGVAGAFDLVTINPPYLIDDHGRAYRDGGGMHGARLALDLAIAATERLAPGGRVILYTGSAIIDGADALRAALGEAAAARRCALRYDETDPDVFGEELETPAYRAVDRIALVTAVIARPPERAFTLRTFRTGDMGMIAARQSILYREAYGWGAGLEVIEGEVTTAFLRGFKPGREQCWVAEVDGAMAGSIFVTDEGAGCARLRLLYVEPFARGRGIGEALIAACIGFARDAGFTAITLWTHTILAGARRLYTAHGFRLVETRTHEAFGTPVEGETWRLEL